MQITLVIIGFFLAGFLARRVISDSTTIVKWVNNFIVYVSLPSIILLKVPPLDFSSLVVVPVGFAWLWVLMGGLMVIALSRWQNWPRSIECAMLLLVTMGNTSYLGYPMVLAFFNDAVLAYAIFYDQLGSFIILSTYGLFIIALYSPSSAGHTERPSTIGVVKKVIGFPPLLALMVALFLPSNGLSGNLLTVLSIMGEVLMPTALFVLGLQFQPRLLPEHKVPLISAITLKMIVAPIFASLSLAIIGASGDMQIATVFEAAMPCMMTPGLIAIGAGIAPRFIATLLGYSTVFAFAWLPVLAWTLG